MIKHSLFFFIFHFLVKVCTNKCWCPLIRRKSIWILINNIIKYYITFTISYWRWALFHHHEKCNTSTHSFARSNPKFHNVFGNASCKPLVLCNWVAHCEQDDGLMWTYIPHCKLPMILRLHIHYPFVWHWR